MSGRASAPVREKRSNLMILFLGTTLAVVHPEGVEIVPLTAFGNPRGATSPSTAKVEAPKLSTENGSL